MNSKIGLFILLTGFLSLNGISGCTWHQGNNSFQNSTCREVLTGITLPEENNLLFHLLDQEEMADQSDSCWRPLVKKMLNQRRDIPLKHLKKAVKSFNHQRDEEIFHKSVYRYLAALGKGKGPYRSVDRNLLESYTSQVIRAATTSEDPHLQQARFLCRRLDSNLYNKFFE